jgi:hypothetical protein
MFVSQFSLELHQQRSAVPCVLQQQCNNRTCSRIARAALSIISFTASGVLNDMPYKGPAPCRMLRRGSGKPWHVFVTAAFTMKTLSARGSAKDFWA